MVPWELHRRRLVGRGVQGSPDSLQVWLEHARRVSVHLCSEAK